MQNTSQNVKTSILGLYILYFYILPKYNNVCYGYTS